MTDQNESSAEPGSDEVQNERTGSSAPVVPQILPLPPLETSSELDVPSHSLAPARLPERESLRTSASEVTRAETIARGAWFGGVLLWSYVVVGEFVVGAEMPEFLGWSVFVGILVGAFLHGANRLGPAAMARVAAACVVAVVLLVFLVSSVLGSSSRAEYQLVSLFLLLLSLAAVLFGERKARRIEHAGQPLPRLTWSRTVYFVILGGNTALMLVAFASQL